MPDEPRSVSTSPTPPTTGLDRLVVARAAAFGVLLAMPAALANVVLADQTPKPKGALNLTLMVLLVGFFIAGVAAGSAAPAQIAKHGAVAALAVYVPVQVVGVLGRLDRGEPVQIITIFVVGFLAAWAGTVGARIGANRRARKEST